MANLIGFPFFLLAERSGSTRSNSKLVGHNDLLPSKTLTDSNGLLTVDTKIPILAIDNGNKDKEIREKLIVGSNKSGGPQVIVTTET